MKHPVSLSIFFPAYNEEENIAHAVKAALRVVEESPYVRTHEIIIINDGSSDRTQEVAERLAAEHPTVRVVAHQGNKGYGAALKTGLAAAQMDYVFFTDADLQFDIVELQNLLVHLDSYDVVIGYRAPRKDPLLRLLNAKGWNLLNRFFFGLKVRDIDCAFKLFKRELVQNLSLKSRGAMISAEILIKLKRQGVAIKEAPVSHLPRLYGSPTGAKLSVIFRAFKEMVLLYGGELGSVTHKQVLKFGSVGVFNTLLDAGVYVFLTRFVLAFADHLVSAKLFSFLFGTVSSFFLNRYWTFGIKTPITLTEVFRFYMTVSAALVVNVGSMYTLVHIFHVYDLVALVLTTFITFGINFLLSKTWVFKQEYGSALNRS